MGQMNRLELIIYALECLMNRDEIDINRYEDMVAQGEATAHDFEWLNYHKKRFNRIKNLIDDIKKGKFHED